MPPEESPGAISAGSGDRIRTCDLWVMSQPAAVSPTAISLIRPRQPLFGRPASSAASRLFASNSACSVPKSVPNTATSSKRASPVPPDHHETELRIWIDSPTRPAHYRCGGSAVTTTDCHPASLGDQRPTRPVCQPCCRDARPEADRPYRCSGLRLTPKPARPAGARAPRSAVTPPTACFATGPESYPARRTCRHVSYSRAGRYVSDHRKDGREPLPLNRS